MRLDPESRLQCPFFAVTRTTESDKQPTQHEANKTNISWELTESGHCWVHKEYAQRWYNFIVRVYHKAHYARCRRARGRNYVVRWYGLWPKERTWQTSQAYLSQVIKWCRDEKAFKSARIWQQTKLSSSIVRKKLENWIGRWRWAPLVGCSLQQLHQKRWATLETENINKGRYTQEGFSWFSS